MERLIKGYIILPYSMKQKLSITMEEKTIKLLEKIVRNERFRNRSHIIEYAVALFLRGKENE